MLFWEIIPVVRVLTTRSPQRATSESSLDKQDFKTPRSARTAIDKANISGLYRFGSSKTTYWRLVRAISLITPSRSGTW